jgi:hypothetical protein
MNSKRRPHDLCEELLKLVKRGAPGENPDVLREALVIVRRLKRSAPTAYQREKLTVIEEQFERWFSASKYRFALDIDADGQQVRDTLMLHITTLWNSWKP